MWFDVSGCVEGCLSMVFECTYFRDVGEGAHLAVLSPERVALSSSDKVGCKLSLAIALLRPMAWRSMFRKARTQSARGFQVISLRDMRKFDQQREQDECLAMVF